MMPRYFVAYFDDEDATLTATADLRMAGFKVHDVYTPYPVHGMDQAMGLRPSRLTWACFTFGLVGLACALALQIGTSAHAWPLNVGGKPFNSFPAFIPVAFELTVLFAALGVVAALFARAKLAPGRTPPLPLVRVTDDRFAIAVVAQADKFDEAEARSLCDRAGMVEAAYVEGRS